MNKHIFAKAEGSTARLVTPRSVEVEILATKKFPKSLYTNLWIKETKNQIFMEKFRSFPFIRGKEL